MKSLSCLLVMLVACAGGAQEGGGEGSGTTPKPGVPAKPIAGDVSFEIAPTPILGVVLEPEALGRPGMPLAHAKKATTIEKERAALAKEKDIVVKQAHAAIIATLLYEQAKGKPEAEQKPIWTDARQVLRDVAQQAGDKNIDETTLRMLGSYEIFLEDWPAAEAAWSKLIEKDAKSKELPEYKAWLAYALLKQFKNADALNVVKDQKVEDKQPELAYATAWAKWRANDDAGAWQAIVVAAKNWGANANAEVVMDDVLLFAGRTNVPFETALPQLQTIFGKNPLQQYDMLAKLGLKAYGFSGRWADALVACDKAIAVGGAAIPPQHVPVIRYSEADFNIRLDTPDVSVKYAKQALESIGAPCGAACNAKDKQDTIEGVYIMARLFHVLFATANDKRYYQPAHDLYAATIPLMTDPALAQTKAQATKDSVVLETTAKNIKVNTGTHDKGALAALLSRHNQEVQACYENELATNPKLGGTIVLTLESDATGVIKGSATEPKAGQADLPQVAGCVAEHAKAWKLPQRGMQGHTRIKMTFQLSLRKAQPAAANGAAAPAAPAGTAPAGTAPAQPAAKSGK